MMISVIAIKDDKYMIMIMMIMIMMIMIMMIVLTTILMSEMMIVKRFRFN